MDEAKRQKAVEDAMALFWEHGAEGASYNDIVAATGLSRKALYAQWPDKDALVHDALQHYRTTVLNEILSPLAEGGVQGLRRFWDSLQVAIKAAANWSGCFLFRSASGPLRRDAFVAMTYEEYAERMRELVAQCVRDGQASGAISQQIDAEAAAWHSLAINGLLSSIGARSGYGPEVDELFDLARVSCGL